MHWTALDGLRGLAVLGVVGFHLGLTPLGAGGWLGVDVFFVVSGLVVTTAFARHRRAGADTVDFLLRRAARLVPALGVYLVAVVVVVVATSSRPAAELRAVAASAAQVANIEMIAAGPLGTPTEHLWSLSIEWQFYLALPVVAAVTAAVTADSARRCTLVVLGAALGSMMLRVAALQWAVASPWAIYLATPTRLDGLLVGVALATVPHRGRRRVGPALSGAALAVVIAAMSLVPRWYEVPVPALVLAIPTVTVATALVVRAVVDGSLPRLASRILSTGPLPWIGQRSYSIYLWHVLVGMVLLGGGETWPGLGPFTVQVTASLVVAALAYSIVEQPARRALTVHIDRRLAARIEPVRAG